MADTAEWLRTLGLIDDTQYLRSKTHTLRGDLEDVRRRVEEDSGAIEDLQAQVRRLQITVTVLCEALADSRGIDPKAFGARLQASLKAVGIRGRRGEGPALAERVDVEAMPKPMECVDCGKSVTMKDSFLRDGARVCQDCY